MKKRRLIFSSVILAAGLLLFLYPDYKIWRQKKKAEEVLQSFSALRQSSEPSTSTSGQSSGSEPSASTSGQSSGSEPSASTSGQSSGSEQSGHSSEQLADLDGNAADASAQEQNSQEQNSQEQDPQEQNSQEQNFRESTESDSFAEGDSDLDRLREELENYNSSLLFGGQELVDCWSYEQNPIPLTYMPDNSDAIGRIRIPDMDVELPLLLGASSENMAKGAVVLAQTSMPIGGIGTNCVIAGHRGYSGMPYFRDIQNLKIGSEVYIDNPWETLKYIVTSIDVILPNDLSCLDIIRNKDMVTLITCHPYMSGGKYRYVVYCERSGDEETVETEETIGTDETAESEGPGSATGQSSSDGSPGSGSLTDSNSVDSDETASLNAYSEFMVLFEIWIRRILAAGFIIWWLILLTGSIRDRKKKSHHSNVP